MRLRVETVPGFDVSWFRYRAWCRLGLELSDARRNLVENECQSSKRGQHGDHDKNRDRLLRPARGDGLPRDFERPDQKPLVRWHMRFGLIRVSQVANAVTVDVASLIARSGRAAVASSWMIGTLPGLYLPLAVVTELTAFATTIHGDRRTS